MDFVDSNTTQQVLRVVWLAVIPLCIVPLAGFVVSLVQGMMGTREDSVAYSARLIAAIGVIMLFGAAVWEGFRELIVYVLR